jgi:sugar phosphate isomerase/epimerase
MDKWPLGVLAGVDVGHGVRLDLLRELDAPTIQLYSPSKLLRTEDRAERFLGLLDKIGVRITAVFAGFDGESYIDIPTVARTVGLTPLATRDARFEEMKDISDFARMLGVEAVGLHIGFVPHGATDPLHRELVAVARELCDYCQANDQNLHLETGQESADTLLEFLGEVGRKNLFINFDPANMILYGCGEPIETLRKVGRYVRSVHCKDAKWAANPGVDWGVETSLGEGDVGIETFLRTLAEVGYTGPLTIEREIPQEPIRQREEIGREIRLLNELKAKIR